jgi:hypothetical protein
VTIQRESKSFFKSLITFPTLKLRNNLLDWQSPSKKDDFNVIKQLQLFVELGVPTIGPHALEHQYGAWMDKVYSSSIHALMDTGDAKAT